MNPGEELQEVKQKLEEHEKRLIALEEKLREKAEQVEMEKPISIGKFISEKKPKSDVQRTLVIGYYLEFIAKKAPFNAKDIEAAFNSAKEPKPNNINLCVYNNIQKRFLMESGEKDNLKAWTLTRTGVEYVDNNLRRSK